MIPFLLMLAASAPGFAASPGLDISLAAGLAVNIERIPEPIAVDGVLMTVQRATGAEVVELARRIEASWRHQGSQLKSRQQDSWNVLSRIQGRHSEVLQWRPDSANPELLLSSVDVNKPVLSLPAAGLTLPAGCTWGRNVAGNAGGQFYLQRSARCPQSMRALSLRLRQSLPTQGWTVRVPTEAGLVVNRAGSEGFIGLSSQEDKSTTWVIWLRVDKSP